MPSPVFGHDEQQLYPAPLRQREEDVRVRWAQPPNTPPWALALTIIVWSLGELLCTPLDQNQGRKSHAHGSRGRLPGARSGAMSSRQATNRGAVVEQSGRNPWQPPAKETAPKLAKTRRLAGGLILEYS